MNSKIYKSYINFFQIQDNTTDSLKILKSLTANYNAVCLDIDGTLVEKGKDNTQLLHKVIALMNNAIPICFITGRGETGIKEFKSQLLNISNKINFDKSIAVINDGVFASEMNNLDNFRPLIDKNVLLQLGPLYIKIKEKYGDSYEIKTSLSSRNNLVSNIRIIADNDILDSLKEDIIDNIGLTITKGTFDGRQVYQIGASNKERSLRQIESIFGIPKNSMLRIGDSGDKDGNDYEILNCAQGFSVGKSSGEFGKCNKVIDETGKRLYGIEATNYLLSILNINQAITLERIHDKDKISYRFKFKRYEDTSNSRTDELMHRYNALVSKIYGTNTSIDDIYDKNCGAIMVQDGELLSNTDLKSLLLDEKYSLKTPNGTILRGGNTYYSLMIMREGKEITKKAIQEWKNNYLSYINDAQKALRNFKITYPSDRKLLLGYLDNLRNIFLLSINKDSISLTKNNGIFSYDKLNPNSYAYKNMQSLLMIDKMLKSLTFKNEIKPELLADFKEKIDIVSSIAKASITNMKSSEHDNQVFRVFREIDNFAENYIATRDAIDSGVKSKNICALAYGGIELAFIAKIIDKNVIPNIMVLDKTITSYGQKTFYGCY